MCFRFDEDGGHCFFKFKLVKNCWRLMNLEQTRLSLKMLDSGRSVVEHILNLEEGRRLQIACLMWCWWDTRNKVNAGEQGSSSTEIVRRANFMASAPAGLMGVRTPSPEGVSAGRSVWKFPHEDELKLNVDGAFYEASNSGGWGFILRNPFALQAAAEWGVRQVEVETDSKVLVTAVQSSSYDQAPGGILFKSIKDVVRRDFVKVVFSHVPRRCNRCAHELAQWGFSRDPGQSSPPRFC